MVFSSLKFTFLFLPVVLLLYFIAKQEYRNGILLVLSLFFYASGEPRFVFVMIGSILVNYGLARWIAIEAESNKGKAQAILVLDLIVNLSLLFVYKYLDFTIMLLNRVTGYRLSLYNIALPIGISFFTFQAMSYVIDVYRGDVKVQKNLMHLALYISFFPQLIAGPIVRYSEIAGQLEQRTCTLEKAASGGKRFIRGFAKKVILANNLSVVATAATQQNVDTGNLFFLWLGAICYTLQIYYDFSGYSDMAIGLGRIFGFEFGENFNYPYISRSVTEFWRRWHISLSGWFRDYVYIPLGGSRVSIPRHVLNMLVVWLLTGIWHGASLTFLVWGLYYFVLLVIEKYLIKPEQRKSIAFKGIWQVVTLLCIHFGWVMFNASRVRTGIGSCLSMLGLQHVELTISSEFIRYLREYGAFILAGLVFSTPILKTMRQKLATTNGVMAVIVPWAEILIYAFLFLWSVSYIILGLHNPFIYFNF